MTAATQTTQTRTNWTVDTSHSSASFVARHLVITKVRGNFNKWTGSIVLDESDVTKSSVELSIDVASIDTREEKRDEHLRSADFFDAANFPKLEFKSKRIQKKGDTLEVTGDLTIRGTTKEVTAEVTQEGRTKDPWGNQRVAFSGKTTIHRSDWGLKWNQALETGGLLVSEKIEIEVELQAIPAK